MTSFAPALSGAATIWVTGLSGAGKTTLANNLANCLAAYERPSVVLDGDELRQGLCRDLGFGMTDRKENVRRIAEVARLLNQRGLLAIAAVISPYREDREMARAIVGADRFVEIYLSTGLHVCEQRDPKCLYARARCGEIDCFTGISAPYEPPLVPALSLDTGELTPAQCCEQVLALLQGR